MALTRSFRATVQARSTRDPAFRQAPFQEAAQVLLEGDLASGRSVLRDYINVPIGFDTLAEVTNAPAKRLMRTLGHKGNPTVVNLFAAIRVPQHKMGVNLEVREVALIRCILNCKSAQEQLLLTQRHNMTPQSLSLGNQINHQFNCAPIERNSP